MDERMEAIVRGRVQMVMFRDYACRKGRRLGLVGEAKNLSDGTVRVVAEGAPVALDRFVRKLWHGSFLSRVEGVEQKRLPALGTYHSFDITYE